MGPAASTDGVAQHPVALYQELGHITRQLHDSLAQLGVMPRLQQAAQGLPDARSRLNFVVEKTSEAAHRVLNSVDAAKVGKRGLDDQSRELMQLLGQPGTSAIPAAAVLAYVQSVQSHTTELDQHLTDIMLAQDFHDLTGQVVRKILDMATALEDSLVHLLVQSAPEELQSLTTKPEPASADLQGPVVAGTQQGDVVSNQGEVDDLLASLGF
jgi:chemotaxis protein CheZ